MDKISIACFVVGALILLGCVASLSLPWAGIVFGAMLMSAGIPWGDV